MVKVYKGHSTKKKWTNNKLYIFIVKNKYSMYSWKKQFTIDHGTRGKGIYKGKDFEKLLRLYIKAIMFQGL